MTLIDQVALAAEMLENAEWATAAERDLWAEKHHFEIGEIYWTETVTGTTDEGRRRSIRESYVRKFAGEELSNPDGTTSYGVLNRQNMLRALEDPLHAETRTARRNLTAVSGLAFLVAMTGETPARIPGFDFDLSAHARVVVGLLLAVLLYQLVAFGVYVKSDLARLRVISRQIEHDSVTVHRALSTIDRLVHFVVEAGYRDTFQPWLAYARRETSDLDGERRTAKVRVGWDVAVPFGLALAALFGLAISRLP
jgi:hypothetical protein